MFRLIRISLGLTLILLLSAEKSRAQGWGWEMWGGWSQTPEGALAQGMGHYYTGAGIFNEKTAIADSINLDTLIRWNEYIYQANLEAARRHVQRRQARIPPIIGPEQGDHRQDSRQPDFSRHRDGRRAQRSDQSTE